MRSAPIWRAVVSSWSNLRWLLQSEQGIGVRPARYSLDEGADDVALEALLLVDDVIGDAEVLGDAAGVVDVVDRAAAALHLLGHALLAGETALVPELHGEADELVALGLEHGRHGRGVDSAGHGYGDRVVDGGLHDSWVGNPIPLGFPGKFNIRAELRS